MIYGWSKPKVTKEENGTYSIHWQYDLDFLYFTEDELHELLNIINDEKEKDNEKNGSR